MACLPTTCLPARAQVSVKPVARTCTATLFPVTFVIAAGDTIATCMCSALIGSDPPPIDMDPLGIGIELDISGIRDDLWPPAAADRCPEPHAAASSASTPAPTATLKTDWGRPPPGARDLDIDRPPQASAPGQTAPSQDAIKDGFETPL